MLLITAGVLAIASSTAAAQPPVAATPYVIDGPSSAISTPSDLGMSVARDGTGGLVYLKSVGGVAHVFVSPLVNGSFRSPVQVDSQLAGASSQPVIAAGNGGVLLVAFINDGQLYVVDGNGNGQYAPPIDLAGGAINPAISMTNFGKAYIAFAVADGNGDDVRTAYYYQGNWSLEGPPLNASPADNAGTGAGRPAVAAAGDGIAIVAWGEQGHIYSRRVWGTAASVVYEQADAPPAGCAEDSVGDPVVGAGGVSSYAQIAFQATLSCGGQQESRVLMNRLQGSVYDGITEADGLSANSSDGADDPQIAVGEYGIGWVTSARTASDNIFAASLGTNTAFSGLTTQVNSLPGSQPLIDVPATAGLNANLIAWQQEPGSVPGGDIRVRYAGNGVALGPETVVSSPAQGPTDAADGFAADGDVSGDVAIAWLQGPSNAPAIVVNELYQPPGAFFAPTTLAYSASTQPVLSWSQPSGWGPMTYSVRIDGSQVAQTSSTSFQTSPLTNGPHTWRIIATNPAGQQSHTVLNTVFVDTVAPTGRLRQLTRAFAGSKFRMVVRYVDRPPAGEPYYDASGVGTVLIRWGDGTVSRPRVGQHFLTHRYKRRGRYKVRVIVIDRAGNRTQIVKYVKVFAARHRHS